MGKPELSSEDINEWVQSMQAACVPLRDRVYRAVADSTKEAAAKQDPSLLESHDSLTKALGVRVDYVLRKLVMEGDVIKVGKHQLTRYAAVL